MSKKVSITLDDDVLSFVDKRASNRSSFINQILLKEQQRWFLQELDEAYIDQENDPVAQAEIALWSVTVSDGLDRLDRERLDAE